MRDATDRPMTPLTFGPAPGEGASFTTDRRAVLPRTPPTPRPRSRPGGAELAQAAGTVSPFQGRAAAGQPMARETGNLSPGLAFPRRR